MLGIPHFLAQMLRPQYTDGLQEATLLFNTRRPNKPGCSALKGSDHRPPFAKGMVG